MKCISLSGSFKLCSDGLVVETAPHLRLKKSSLSNMLKGCSFEDFEKSHLTEKDPYNLKGLNVSRKAMETLWLEEKIQKFSSF